MRLFTAACFLVALTGARVFAYQEHGDVRSPDPPSVAVPSPTPPTPPAVRLYMPDGQLKSHSIRIYVTAEILPSQAPRLRLLRSHAVTKAAVDEAVPFEPGVVAPGQDWMESVDGVQIRRSGTLLLFDISNVDFAGRATLRVMPILSWESGGASRLVVGESEVNVGNIVAAIAWTTVVVGAALLIIILLARRRAQRALLFLAGVDGHLSLAQAQVACWTIVVGGVVLGYGFVRLQIPDIPASLVVLMGASLATGGIAYLQDVKQQAAVDAVAGPVPASRTPRWGDLVRVFTPTEEPQLSLSKAQMVFWTILLLVIFVSKSILDGGIWEVPWPLVALMGFSQAGYLAPKLVQPEKG